jgi:hypothetical protein
VLVPEILSPFVPEICTSQPEGACEMMDTITLMVGAATAGPKEWCEVGEMIFAQAMVDIGARYAAS